MKRSIFLLLFFFSFSLVAAAATPEKIIFGPVKYDVKERYGKNNVYKDTLTGGEGLFVVKLQNGAQVFERSEFIEFKLNQEILMRDASYDYSFVACVVPLRNENSFEINLKDSQPAGFKRPPLPPRFVTITVMPFAGTLPPGVYGVDSWEGLTQIAGIIQKMTNPESASLAASTINLKNDVATRAEAMRKLSDLKDATAFAFMSAIYNDMRISGDIRGEAALGLGLLGDKSTIPSLINGVLDPDEKTRLGASRALSFYSEDDTRERLAQMLSKLDSMRKDAVIRAIVKAGWKPVSTLLSAAESNDPSVSETAIGILGTTGDPRAIELLLKLFQQPGARNIKVIIAALGETKDPRAIEPLAAMAKDRAKRTGSEAELGTALANLGDLNSAELIADMIKKADSRLTWLRLRTAYKKLTGKEYK